MLRDMVGFRGFLAELVAGSDGGTARGHQPHGTRCKAMSQLSPSWVQVQWDPSEGKGMVRQASHGPAPTCVCP